MDRINASMSRLSMLISLAETKESQKTLNHEEGFKRDLIAWMDRVHTLYKTLKLYNNHLTETEENTYKSNSSNY